MTDQKHSHEAVVHGHEHIHVTHYARHGEETTHLEAVHEHEHNHPALDHTHEAHEDQEKEHPREAHIHDHESSADSPG